MITTGIRVATNRTENNVLKSKFLLYNANWILEKAARGIQTHEKEMTFPLPGLPTMAAIGSANIIIPTHMHRDRIKFAQNAVVTVWYNMNSMMMKISIKQSQQHFGQI